MNERQIETELLDKLTELKYTPRPDIRDRDALEANFRQKFEALNRVRLEDTEFQRLLERIKTPDVFAAARSDKKIVLIDGARLADLMIEHDLGVSVAATYRLKRIDTDFFIED